MKRISLILLMFSSTAYIAKEIDENFDSYTTGVFTAANSPIVATLSVGSADDSLISDPIFHSAPNCISLFSDAVNGGSGNVIVPLDFSDMGYMVSFCMLVNFPLTSLTF